MGHCGVPIRLPRDRLERQREGNEPVPEGVYYYLLTLGDVEYPGVVEVLR